MENLIKSKYISKYATFILTEIQKDPIDELCIVGGVALNHYIPYRTTDDLDTSWINGKPNLNTLRKLEIIGNKLSKEYNLIMKKEDNNTVNSFNFFNKQDEKVFSIDCSIRSKFVEKKLIKPLNPSIQGIQVESLYDNITSKVTALIERGIPRDITDTIEIIKKTNISFEVIMTNLTNYYKWSDKEKSQKLDKIEKNVNAIFTRRPINKFKNPKKALNTRKKIYKILFKKEYTNESITKT